MSLFLGTFFFMAAGGLGAMSARLWAKNHVALVRILAVTMAFCMWLSYALIYIAQLNPLIHPTRNIKAE